MAYWLFQIGAQQFPLAEALRLDAVHTFPVKAHRDKIKKGDKVILWQTGKRAGVYALAEVESEVGTWKLDAAQKGFYQQPPNTKENVRLKIEYNLWNRPITKNILTESKAFDKFNAGLPGTNYKATAKQYQRITQLAQQEDTAEEPIESYTENLPEPPLNLILSGPPGTGKTYQSVNHALSIIERRSLEELELEDRAVRHIRYKEYLDEGLIFFVTFHQSFTYEDFVEGIKPVSHNGQIGYEIQNGIFKQVALAASRELVDDIMDAIPAPHELVEFKALYKSFLQYLKSDGFENFIGPNGGKLFLHRIERSGNLKVRKEKFFGLGMVSRKKLEKVYYEFQALDAEELQDPIAVIKATINASDPENYLLVLAELKQFEQSYLETADLVDDPHSEETDLSEISVQQFSEIARQTTERFVLIIDEINRANIPAVFGELISLIEPDKREGAPETLRVILPYSKTEFSVPPNLYIIGTMNTADRSIENLDFALRRRFAFQSVQPDPSIISRLNQQPLMDGIHLERMLRTINQRIGLLLDEEHCIGHAYFLTIRTLHDLQTVFDRFIIPLLKEYFFAAIGEIGLVLGKGFMIIKKNDPDIFPDFQHDTIMSISDRRQYEVRSAYAVDANGFIRIYES